MHRSPMFQIADHCNDKAIDGPDFLTNRENIEESLSWVFPDAISSIDQGLATLLCSALQKFRKLYFFMQ